jgi:hypothetical protein
LATPHHTPTSSAQEEEKGWGQKHIFLHTKIFLLKGKVDNCVSRHMEKEWTHRFINVLYLEITTTTFHKTGNICIM